MQENNTERLKFQDFYICTNIVHADADNDVGWIAIKCRRAKIRESYAY